MMFKEVKNSPIVNKEVLVVFKHSRYSYAMDRGSPSEKLSLLDINDPITKDLLIAHEKNLLSINQITSILDDLKIRYRMLCRSDITKSDLIDKFVISIGGDGTLLDVSHYCDDSPILGVNSDPISSIGALCAAQESNFRDVLLEIYRGELLPIPLTRLSLTIDDEPCEINPLNDVLFCNKNPAAMSRFILSLAGKKESYRSSGIWIATPAGSTGGIYSSGGEALPLEEAYAIFRQREPYWSDTTTPELLHGTIAKGSRFKIRSNMTDGAIFIDGSHKSIDINLGQTIELSVGEKPLWLFDGPRLNKNRKRIIEQRKLIRNFL